MFKKLFLLTILCASISFSQSTDEIRKNSVFFEAGSSGLMFSLNYERFFTNFLSLRMGIGYVTTDDVETGTLPLTANFYINLTSEHFIELSLGYTILI